MRVSETGRVALSIMAKGGANRSVLALEYLQSPSAYSSRGSANGEYRLTPLARSQQVSDLVVIPSYTAATGEHLALIGRTNHCARFEAGDALASLAALPFGGGGRSAALPSVGALSASRDFCSPSAK